MPDGPNVIEHYASIIERLAPRVRVVCFDMPGFGFSSASADYRHTLDQGAGAVLGVLDALLVPRVNHAFSCANGLYALRVARLAPSRVASLILWQTPSLGAMQAWARRVIPKPLRIPLLGQTVAWAFRERLASRWYEMALPRFHDPAPFRQLAQHALRDGGCFSPAGVVQGLLTGPAGNLSGVSTFCSSSWGESDRTHRRIDPESLRLHASEVRVSRCDGLGHFPDVGDPERFVSLLTAQVASCLRIRHRL